MQSVSALDLVSGALKSTLARAQKNYDFNSSSFKIKKNHRVKDESDNLDVDSGRDKDFNYWNIAVKSNKLQFSTSGYQLSSFISTIRSKYECLNPIEKEDSQKTNHHKKLKLLKPKFLVCNKLRGKNKSGKCVKNATHDSAVESTECPRVQEKLKKLHSQNNSVKNLNTDSKLFSNPNEIFEKLKERRKEVRRKKKEARKLARLEKLKAVEPNLFCPDIVGKREKENKNFLHSKISNHIEKLSKKNRIMKEAASNSANVVNGVSACNANQLSQPRVVLFPRNKVVPGWKTKLPTGCGLINLGNSCYMNASLQALFHTPAFVNWLLDDNDHKQNCRNSGQCFQSCIICAMYSTLRESLNRNNQCLRPLQIHNKLKVICKHFTHGRQEDAHEFLRYLLESMERSYLAAINSLRLDNRSKETTPLGQIFGGYLRTEVTCLKCNCISTTFQPLAELQLDIRHVTTLEDAIQNHFKKERLDNNDYKCEKCHTLSPATKQFSLEIPPIVLCLQLKRFTLYGNKITKPIHCNRSLNLTRYLHKSHQEVGQGDIKYRLVALVTHMGSSPNCGHYTAIAETSTGNFYQFDDSFVRQVSVQTALNTDAYVIIYEMDRNQNQIGAATSINNHFNGKPATVTSSVQTITSPISVNGNANSLGNRLDSPAPAPKKFCLPFMKTPTSENSTLRNSTMGSPSVPNTPTKINTTNSFSTSSKPLISIKTAPCFEFTRVTVTKSPPNSLAPAPLVDQQYGVKRKLDDIMEKKETPKLENKQPRLITSITTGVINDTATVVYHKPNGTMSQPVGSTSCWKVISNGELQKGSPDKQSDNFRKASNKSGGYCSDPETKSKGNSKHVDFHRAKSVERLLDSQTNKTDTSIKKFPERNSVLNRSPEKLRKSPTLEISSHVNGFAQNGESKIKDGGISTNVYTNGYGKVNEQNRLKDPTNLPKPRQESTFSLLLERPTSSPSTESSSDEKRKSRSNKHKKKSKRDKNKKKKKKSHKRSPSSSNSSNSSSSSESENETTEIKKKHKTKVVDTDRGHKSNKKHKMKNGSINEERSPQTTSTGLSDDGSRKQLKYNDKIEGPPPETDVIRSTSEERERDRRKNRNPSRSRSPDRRDGSKDNGKFDVSKLVTRDKQIASWNGTESTLSKSIDVDRKGRKSKIEEFDEEMDAGRVKKSRKSRSPSRDTENGTPGNNKFQCYEDRKKTVSEWSKVLDGYGENFRDRNKYSEKGSGKGNGDYQAQKYRSSNNLFSSSYSGSYNHSNRNSHFRGGRNNFGRNRYSENNRNYHNHSNSFRRDNRDRRPS